MLFKIISPRNYYFATRTIFPGSMVQSMYLNLTVANFLFVFYILDVKSFRTYRNINISNLILSSSWGLPFNVSLTLRWMDGNGYFIDQVCHALTYTMYSVQCHNMIVHRWPGVMMQLISGQSFYTLHDKLWVNNASHKISQKWASQRKCPPNLLNVGKREPGTWPLNYLP